MGHYRSFRAYAQKFDELSRPNGILVQRIRDSLHASGDDAVREVTKQVKRDIYDRYIPTVEEYVEVKRKRDPRYKAAQARHKAGLKKARERAKART